MIVTCESTTTELSLLTMTRKVFELAKELPVRNANIRPTLPFLKRVAKLLSDHGLPCDTTAAWQFWQLIVETADACAEQLEIDSEIAWHYHIDPSHLTERIKLGLERNIARNRARQMLADGDYSPTDYEGVYALALCATGNEDYAQRMKTEAFKRYVDQQSKRG